MKNKNQFSLINDNYLKNHGQIHDVKYFAMLNNAVAIENTQYEGGLPHEAMAYYEYILTLELPDCPIDFNLDPQIVTLLKTRIADLKKITALLEKHYKDPKDIPTLIDDVLAHIKNASAESGVCYFPSGWNNDDGGHYASLKLRRLANGNFALSFLNHGAGMNYHRQLSQSGSKLKLCYQSNEYEVNLYDGNGRQLLQNLIDLRYDLNRKKYHQDKINPYSEIDLYGLLEMHGKELEFLDKLTEKSATPQRTGTCPITNIHAPMRDTLIDCNVKFKKRKRYHFVFKLRSLIAEFECYRNHNRPRDLLEWSLREFAVRLNKQYNNIVNEEEMLYCGRLQQEIQQQLNNDKQQQLDKLYEPKEWPNFSGKAPIGHQEAFFKITDLISEERAADKKHETEVTTEINADSITILTVTNILQDAVNNFNDKDFSLHSQGIGFKKTYTLMNSLPHPTGLEQDPFWDNVPQDQVRTIIEHLFCLVKQLQVQDKSTKLHRARSVAFAFIAYDIAAQIAPRCKEFKLNNKYTFGLDNVFSEYYFYSDPIVFYTIKRIAKNFEQRAKNKERVLTNAINFDTDKYDKTIHYIIREILDENQRQIVQQNLPDNANDQDLFKCLIDHWKELENNEQHILDPLILKIIGLSAKAHNIGGKKVNTRENIYTYIKDANSDRWFFADCQYFNDLTSISKINSLNFNSINLNKHIPSINKKNNVAYQDYAENTIYHPRGDLERLQQENRYSKSSPTDNYQFFHYATDVSFQAYQIYLSGSIRPQSDPWNTIVCKKDSKEDTQFDEELNEDFRHIECTPHLQIVRTLAWATNNYEKLSIDKVEKRINELLFQYGRLDNALFHNREATITSILNFFKKSYLRIEKETNSTIISTIIDLSFHLKNYIEVTAKLYHFPLEQISWVNYRFLILKKIQTTQNSFQRSIFASKYIYTYHKVSSLSLQDCCSILICRLIATLGNIDDNISDEIWHKLNDELIKTLYINKEAALEELNKLMPNYFQFHSENNWIFSGKGCLSNNVDLTIDLYSGYLAQQGVSNLQECDGWYFYCNKDLFDSLNLSVANVKLFYAATPNTDRVLRSLDGRWEFYGQLDNPSPYSALKIKTAYQNIAIEGQLVKFKLENEQDKLYQTWIATENNLQLFYQIPGSPFAYFCDKSTGINYQLECNEKGEWHRNNRFLLNTENGFYELEKEWGEIFSAISNKTNLRCIAELNEDKITWQIKKIEFPTLDLSFTVNDKQQLISDQYPGSFISKQKTIPALNGFCTVIILENEEGNKHYLIPAFSFLEGKKNNSFNSTDIIDINNRCYSNRAYYTYVLNAQGEITGETVAADLYLAILYRSQGDFEKAVRSLQRCHTHININAELLSITLQLMVRKIKSPMAAAFDLKLASYLNEHQRKWSVNTLQKFEPVIIPNTWKEWIVEQFKFYEKTISNFKDGVAIVPAYCRLTKNECYFLSIKEDAPSGEKNETLKERKFSLGDRITEFQKKEINSVIFTGNQIKEFDRLLIKENFEVIEPRSLRIYSGGIDNPGFNYLVQHFGVFLQEARSRDPIRLQLLRANLFCLLQNDLTPIKELYQLIYIILIVSEFPNYFDELIIENKAFSQLLQGVSTFIQIYHSDMKDKQISLFADKNTVDVIQIEKSLKSDFSPLDVFFELNEIQYKKTCKHPLQSIFKQYFTKTSLPLTQGKFPLDISGIPNATLLEKKLLNHFEKGHQKNLEKNKLDYKLIVGTKLQDLKVNLEGSINEDNKLIDKNKKQLLKIANKIAFSENIIKNSISASAYNLLAARLSENKKTIDLNDIFTAYLEQKPELLTAQNPFLSQNDINKLFSKFSDIMLLQSRVDQAKQALNQIGKADSFSNLKPYDLQLIAGTLNKERSYNVNAYPEFLIYEYTTGRLLRDDQVDIIIRIIQLIESEITSEDEVRHALLQFAAGGGKTSVLIPILSNRFSRKGIMPVIFNTPELYDIGLKEIPRNLQVSYQKKIEVIECELEHQWNNNELITLFTDLKRWQKEGKCLLLKPIAWHALNISRKLAFFEKDFVKTSLIKMVLDFFKYETVKLEDECQIISDSLQQSIKTFGQVVNMPEEQLDLLFCYYDYLLDIYGDSHYIANLAGIKFNRKRPISDEELKNLKKELADRIILESHFKMIDSHDLKSYLLQDEKDKPQWLKDLHKSDENRADLVVLARAFIQTHLPYLLSLQYLRDYGASIHEGDLTAAPKHEGGDVNSHFADHTLLAALTIQFYNKGGLLPDAVKKIFGKLNSEHKKEREWNKNLSVPTLAEQFLLQYIPDSYPFRCFNDLSSEMMNKLASDEEFSQQPQVIKYFLKVFAMPQIKMPSERQSSTAAEFQAGFQRSILFSATPSIRQKYPAFLNDEYCFLEEAFEAQVIETLLSAQNCGALLLTEDMKNPDDFFQQIPDDLLNKMTTLIDRGALLTDFAAIDIINTYLNQEASRRPTGVTAFFSGKRLFLKSTDPKVKNAVIEGSGLIEELKKQNIKPEQFLLFLFLDLSKTTGTDIKRPYKDHAGLTIGREQTVTETIQAAMRERQLLDYDAQSITWIMFEALYHAIHPEDKNTFDLKKIFYWMIENEAETLETEIINRAYQGIDQAISSLAWERIHTPADWDNYQRALRQTQSFSPYNIYEIESKKENTDSVLYEYFENLLSIFNFLKNDIPATSMQRIEDIIHETKSLINELPNPAKTVLNAKVLQNEQSQQEQEQKKEQQQKQRMKTRLDSGSDFQFALEEYSIEEDELSYIFNDDTRAQNQRYIYLNLPDCEKIKQPELLICLQHFAVTHRANNLEIQQLKPIAMLLMQITPKNNQLKFLAITATGAEYFSALLNNYLHTDEPIMYAIISINGDVLQTSMNLSIKLCQQYIAYEACQKILTYSHFLNGNLSQLTLLSQIINENNWSAKDYKTIINSIKRIHVSQHPVLLSNNTALEKLCGWIILKDLTIDAANKVAARYQFNPSLNNENKPVFESLISIDSLENMIVTTPEPILPLGSPLASYLFDEAPYPMDKTPEKLILEKQFNKILSKFQITDPSILLLLQKRIINILLLPVGSLDKEKNLESFYDYFNELHQVLANINALFLSIVNSDKDFLENALRQVRNTYIQFLNGRSIDACYSYLKDKLSLLAAETPNPQLNEGDKTNFNIAFFASQCSAPDPLKEVIEYINLKSISNPKLASQYPNNSFVI